MFVTTIHKTLTTTTETELFTVPEGFVVNVYYIFVHNHSGSTKGVTLKWTNHDNTEDQLYFLDDKNISDGERETLGGQSSMPLFVIQQNEVVRCSIDGTGEVEVAMTVDLLPRTPGYASFD